MQVTKYITLDLLETGSPVIIKAKQNDRNTRYIAAHLYVDGLAYPVPSGTEIAFRYKKPDGTAGFYDALPNNSPAITVSGNTVTVELVEQVLTVAGCVHCEINMYNAASEKLTTFTFEISVEESVLTDAEIISSDYYNVLTAEIAKALQAVTDATEQAENAAQSAQDAADNAAMSKDWAAGQPVTYNGTPVSIAYAGAQRIAAITAYGETPQGGTTEAPVALTGVDSVFVSGNNLLPKAVRTETTGGITFTPNRDGSILVSGTATTNVGYSYAHFERALLGRTVCLSGGSTQAQVLINERLSSGAFVRNVLVDRGQGISGILTKQKEDNILYATIQVLAGTTVNTTIYPMLNLGESPLPFEPYQGSVTQLPIPRPLHKVGDVRDVCRTRVKSVYDKRIVLSSADGFAFSGNAGNGYARFYKVYNLVRLSPIASDWLPGYAKTAYNATNEGVYSADSDAGAKSIVLSIKRLIAAGATSGDTSTYLTAASAIFAATPLTVYYQSTAYDGTNGLEVCLTEYQTDYIESYADESITTAWISSTGALSTGAEVAYVLSSPETYATDPLDIDNAAGPLTVLTGGAVEVRMTELIGTRSDVSNNTVAFSEASQDADIQTGEKLSVLFGKIKKRLSLLQAKADNSLQTTVKTVIGAINEVLGRTKATKTTLNASDALSPTGNGIAYVYTQGDMKTLLAEMSSLGNFDAGRTLFVFAGDLRPSSMICFTGFIDRAPKTFFIYPNGELKTLETSINLNQTLVLNVTYK